MRRIALAVLVASVGLAILNAGVPATRSRGVPALEPPLHLEGDPFAPMAMPKGDIRHTFPETWREALGFGGNARRGHLAASQGRLVVSPRVGIGPLAIRILWHVPEGLHGVARLTATQTDVEPPMTACSTSRDLQGRAETIEATWTLPSGLWDVSGCVAGRCVAQSVVVS